MFVFEQTSKSNCDIPMPIPTGDTLFPDITEPPLFWSSKLIRLLIRHKWVTNAFLYGPDHDALISQDLVQRSRSNLPRICFTARNIDSSCIF